MRHFTSVVPTVLLALFALACGGPPTVYFETDASGSSTVQGSPLGGFIDQFPSAASFANIDFSQTQDFKNQGVTKEDVRSVKLKKVTLQISAPNDQDFSWLQSIKFFAETDGKKELIAYKDNIDQLGLKAPNPLIELDLNDVELAPYVTADSMSITTEGNGHQPSTDTTIEAKLRIGVDAVLIKSPTR